MSKIRQFIDYLYNLCYNKRMSRSSYTRATDRNRRRIQEAFAELLAERGSITNITVTNLAERAEITRGTFYNYYNNLYEVGAEIQKEVERKLFLRWDHLASIENINQYVDEVFDYIRGQEDAYSGLLASDAIDNFFIQIENGMSKRMISIMHSDGVCHKEAELELLFTINGAIAIVRKYFRKEVSLSLEEIRDYLKARLGWIFREYIRANNAV